MRTKAELIDSIRTDQRFWRDLAAEVGPERYLDAGPMGEWSFADLAGHLFGWRDRTIRRLEAAARGEADPPPPWPAELDDDDRVNDWIRASHAGRAPEQLVADYDAAYDRLIAALESLPEEWLTDASALPWVGVPLVEVDFGSHLHDEHVPTLRAWLDANRARRE